MGMTGRHSRPQHAGCGGVVKVEIPTYDSLDRQGKSPGPRNSQPSDDWVCDIHLEQYVHWSSPNGRHVESCYDAGVTLQTKGGATARRRIHTRLLFRRLNCNAQRPLFPVNLPVYLLLARITTNPTKFLLRIGRLRIIINVKINRILKWWV